MKLANINRYRRQIGQHENHLYDRRKTKTNSNQQTYIANTHHHYGLSFSPTTLLPLAITLANIKKAQTEENPPLPIHNTSSTSDNINPRNILKFAFKTIGTFGTENPPIYASKEPSKDLSLIAQPNLTVISPFNLVAHLDPFQLERAKRSPSFSSVHQADHHTTNKIDISNTDIQLHQAFIQYMDSSSPSLKVKDIQAALTTYFQKNTRSYFDQDPDLQKFICNALGLHYEPGEHINQIANQLALSLTTTIDFYRTRAGIKTSYDGYTFRELQNTPLHQAKQQALHFLKTAIKEKFTKLNDKVITSLAEARLESLAPELSILKSDDSTNRNICYGSRQWGNLIAGIATTRNLGLDYKTFTINDLIQFGKTYLENNAIIPSATEALSVPKKTGISLSQFTLLKMANANGALSLHTAKPDNQNDLVKRLEKYISQTFKQELEYLKALQQLQQPIPLRRKIAEDIITQAGEDPNRLISVYSTGTGTKYYASNQQKSLAEIYMDRDAGGFFYTQIINDEQYQTFFNDKPNLNQRFTSSFSQYCTNFEQGLKTILKAQLKNLIGDNQDKATFNLKTARLTFSPKVSVSLLSFGSIHINGKAYFLEKTNHQGAKQYFILIKDELNKGFQALPKETNLALWVHKHKKKVFENGQLKQYQKKYKHYLQYTKFKESHSGNLETIIASTAAQFVADHISPLKKQAYKRTNFEQAAHFARDTFLGSIPVLGTVHYALQGDKASAVISGVTDSLSFFLCFLNPASTLLQETNQLVSQTALEAVSQWKPSYQAVNNAARSMTRSEVSLAKESAQSFWPTTVDFFSPVSCKLEQQLRETNVGTLGLTANKLRVQSKQLAQRLDDMANRHISFRNKQWITTQPPEISARVAHNSQHSEIYQAKRIISGKEYAVEQIGSQTNVLLKKHTQGGHEYFTQVNPFTDKSYGPRLVKSSSGKLYLNQDSTAISLRGYQTEHINPSLPANTKPIIIGKNGFEARIGQHTYPIELREDETITIVHPHRLPIPVELTDSQWSIPVDDIPEQFKDLPLDASQTYRHWKTNDELIVAHLSHKDEMGNIMTDRIVALKPEGGKFCEIDWSTGTPRRDRPLVYKNSVGRYENNLLLGGNPSNKNKVDIHQRYISSLNAIKSSQRSNIKTEFNEGAQSYRTISIPGYQQEMSSDALKNLFIEQNTALNTKQKGALSEYIRLAEESELPQKVERFLMMHQKKFKTASLKRLLPQDHLPGVCAGSGRCLPLVILTAKALKKNNPQAVVNQLFDNLVHIANHPSMESSRKFMTALAKLHHAGLFSSVSTRLGKGTVDFYVNNLLKKTRELEVWAVNTKMHSMLLGVDSHRNFYFYDPNLGIYSFKNSKDLLSSLNTYLDKHLGEYYGADLTASNKPQFIFYRLDLQRIVLDQTLNHLLSD